MHISKPLLIVCLILTGASLVSSCSVEAKLEKYPDLKARVTQYYQAEQNADWEQTYNLRSPDFRKTVLKETYIARMRKDNAGWKLKGYEIKSVVEKRGKVYLTIDFIEEPPPEGFHNEALLKHLPPETPPLKTFQIRDDSIWILANGVWYCDGAGQRLHLTMNAPNS